MCRGYLYPIYKTNQTFLKSVERIKGKLKETHRRRDRHVPVVWIIRQQGIWRR
ncbi:hypothetical protein Hanom_Chr02g00142271 [Helianthus anomalus]